MALGWLATAINGGGVDYQRWVEPGGQVRPGGGVNDDSYQVVEAALFSRPKGATLIVQNAGPQPRSLDLAGVVGMGPPARIETLSLPDLVDEGRRAAQPRVLASAPTIELPAYSVTRVVRS
jgi:hypothetical protein